MKKIVVLKMLVPTAIGLTLLLATQASAELPSERRLYTDRVEASSFLENDWNRFVENYHPNYIGDDDRKTAWTEGTTGAGEGEWLRVHVTKLTNATQLRIKVRNGYQKSKRLFRRNARGKDITIRLLPSGVEVKRVLTDSWSWQEISVAQPAGVLSGFEVHFNSVYPGTHYEDLCISDMQTFVTAQVPDNPSFEIARRKRLLAWKRKRLDAAKVFQSSRPNGVPLAPQYRAKTIGRPTRNERMACQALPFCTTKKVLQSAIVQWPKHLATLKGAQQAFVTNFSGWRYSRTSVSDKRPIPQVDGAWIRPPYEDGYINDSSFALPQPNQLGYLNSEHIKRVHPDKGLATIDRAFDANLPGCKSLGRTGKYMWTPASTEGVLRSLLVIECGKYEERDGEWKVATWQLLLYEATGQLEFIVGPGYVSRLTWSGQAIDAYIREVERVTAIGIATTLFTAMGRK